MDPFGAQIIKNLNVLKTYEFPLSLTIFFVAIASSMRKENL